MTKCIFFVTAAFICFNLGAAHKQRNVQQISLSPHSSQVQQAMQHVRSFRRNDFHNHISLVLAQWDEVHSESLANNMMQLFNSARSNDQTGFIAAARNLNVTFE